MKIQIIYINILLLVFGITNITAQEDIPEYKQMMLNPAGLTLAEIQDKAEEYFADQEEDKTEWDSEYNKWKRWEYLMERRLTPDGKVTNVAAQNYQAYQNYKENVGPLKSPNGDDPETTYGYWDFIGPTNYTTGAGWNGGVGRVNCIAFHPALSSYIYIGLPAGGLWRTTNGGTTWECLTDGMPSIGVSGIAVISTNTIYILTGDGDGGDTQSIGVMKTTDGGKTWYQTGLAWDVTDMNRGYKLLKHPSQSNTLFAATTNGIYKTTNGGTNWTQVATGSVQDIEFKPYDPTIMYASRGTQFLRSTNTGDSWTQITSGVPTNAWRMAIGVSDANSSYVYLHTGPATAVGSFVGVYRSYDSGLNFGLKANTPNLLGYAQNGQDNDHQTTYDLAVAVSRTDVGDIIVGGINTWASADFGATYSITSWWKTTGNTIGYTHADIHALEINPLNNYLYCGSDGGIFRSTDFGNTWTDLTASLGATQWYRIDGTEASSSLLIGGTQDNGSNKWDGSLTMTHMRGADGMDAMIDHSNSSIFYTTRQYGLLEKSTNGGSSFTDITPGGVSGPWVTPLVMNPSTSTTIYGGYSDVMKSTNGGSSWTNTGVSGTGAMAIGTSFTGRIYASSGTSIWRSDDAAGTWNSISSGLPFNTITFIAVDPTNSLNVFVTVGGYSDGQKVYESANGGASGSWVNISGSLPNVPVNCIAYEPGSADGLYIGTDIGVFYRDDNTGDWVPFMNGLPTVPVFDLEINETSGVIRAATFGRGLWSSALYTPCPTGYFLTQGNDPSNPNFTGFQVYEASATVESSRIITGGFGTDVTYKAGNSVTLQTGFHAQAGNLFKAELGPCSGLKGPVDPVETEDNPLPVVVSNNNNSD